jgi:hypothetical protein
MHASLQALFDEHKQPQHAGKRDVHDQLKPILAAAARINKQMAVYRDLHLTAKLDDHDHLLDGKQEMLRQKFAAGERLAAEFIAAGERLADVMTEIEQEMVKGEADIIRHEGFVATNAAKVAETPAP